MVKRCPRCGLSKPLTSFYRDKSKASGVVSHCKECVSRKAYDRERSKRYFQANREAQNARARARHQANPERHRQEVAAWRQANPEKHRRWREQDSARHGLAAGEWERIWNASKGLCYLCEQPLPATNRQLHVDHDHTHCPPGRSCAICRRGLAHSNCNTAIGLAGDDPGRLRLMADNLERAQSAVWQRITAAPRQGGLFV